MGSAAAVTQVNLKHSTARHSRAQHGTAQQSTARHNTGRNSPAQPKTAQPSPTQHSTAQHQRQQQNPLAADQINGAAHVDIHKVHVTVLLDQLSSTCQGICIATTHLYPEHIFTWVAFQQGPF